MAAQPASQVISETAKSEGGPEKGSTSAQMQSQVGKTRNFEQAAQVSICLLGLRFPHKSSAFHEFQTTVC